MTLPLELFSVPVCAGARLVLAALVSAAGDEPVIALPLADLARAVGLGRRVVADHLRSLAAAQLLERAATIAAGRVVPAWRLKLPRSAD